MMTGKMLELQVDHPARVLTPERDLLVAILQRAILDYVGSNGFVRDEAEEWLESEDDTSFSFRWVCGHLGLEPESVRKNVQRIDSGPRREASPLRVLRRSA